MTTTDTTLLDMDSLLNDSLDGTPDVPEFINPPNGSYILCVADAKVEKYKSKGKDEVEETEKTRIRINYSVVQVVELKDKGEDVPAPGSLFSETFMANVDGLSFFKRQAKNILGEDNIKGVPLKDILAELPKNHNFKATIRVKETKGTGENAGKTYSNTQVRILDAADPLDLEATGDVAAATA